MILALALNGIDLGIFAVYMIATVAVGFLVARRGRSSSRAYFLGDRKLPWYVIDTSMVAADVSAVSIDRIGHYAAMEAPQRLADALLSFYEKVDGPR